MLVSSFASESPARGALLRLSNQVCLSPPHTRRNLYRCTKPFGRGRRTFSCCPPNGPGYLMKVICHERRTTRLKLPLVCDSALPLICLTLAVTLAGCGKSKAEPSADTKIEANSDPNVFTLPHPEQFPLVEVELRKVSDELHVNGVIAPDVNRSVPVVSLGGGRVVEIKAKLGDTVKKGQTLLLIDSPDVSQAFSDYQKFKADEQLAAKQMARAQLLYDKGAIALADLETAQDADAKAKVDTQTAAQRIKVLGGNINNPVAAVAGGRPDFRSDCRSADYGRYGREVAGQLAQPVHHR